jgi:hypothetical protein
MLSEAKHPRMSLKINAEILRCALLKSPANTFVSNEVPILELTLISRNAYPGFSSPWVGRRPMEHSG